jgi:hypothetical protein
MIRELTSYKVIDTELESEQNTGKISLCRDKLKFSSLRFIQLRSLGLKYLVANVSIALIGRYYGNIFLIEEIQILVEMNAIFVVLQISVQRLRIDLVKI